MDSTFPFDRELFGIYAFYASLLLTKLLLMSPLTTRQRFLHGSFISKEDIAGREEKLKCGVGICDDVERMRNAHRNDLENIIPFIILSFLYIFTGPTISFASLTFRIFSLARFL